MADPLETRTARSQRWLIWPVAALLLSVSAGCASVRPAASNPLTRSDIRQPAVAGRSDAPVDVVDTEGATANSSTETPPEPLPSPAPRDVVRQVAAIDRIEEVPEPPGTDQPLAPAPGAVIPDDPLDRPPATAAEAAMRDAGNLISRGEPENARAILLIAARQRPVDPALCVALARINESLKNWKEAADWYAAADDQPRAANAPGMLPQWERQRARCLYRDGDCTTACALWAASIAVKDRAVSLAELVEYADACLQTDDQDTAQLLLDQASARTSGRIRELELLRATCALRRGDVAAAQRVATAALDEWPHEERFVRLVKFVAADETLSAADEPMDADSESVPASDLRPARVDARDAEGSAVNDRPRTPYGRQ
ncbi:MAG: hypothetical protein IT428_14280 [Planctomycetaceae bacterium]|nr:hypothetical protein [Planctomycetaceae bacterium]